LKFQKSEFQKSEFEKSEFWKSEKQKSKKWGFRALILPGLFHFDVTEESFQTARKDATIIGFRESGSFFSSAP